MAALIHGEALRLEGGAVVMKGGQAMPGRDGTGPMGAGRSTGRGVGGCGQPRGAQGQNGAGFAPGGRKRGMNCAATTAGQPTRTTGQDIKGKFQRYPNTHCKGM